MHKTLLSFIFFIVFVQLGFSQLSVSSNTFEQSLEVGVDTETSIYITNNSNATKTVTWERSANFPEGWINFICDEQQCFGPATGTSEISIAPGAVYLVKVTTRATTQADNSMTMTFTDNGNLSDSEVVAINYTVYAVGVEDFDVVQLSVYPNPTSDYFKLSNSEGINSLEVYNLIGRKTKVFTNIGSNSSFNIYDLPKGMYLIRLLDEDSDLVTTRRISKR